MHSSLICTLLCSLYYTPCSPVQKKIISSKKQNKKAVINFFQADNGFQIFFVIGTLMPMSALSFGGDNNNHIHKDEREKEIENKSEIFH